ncbi:hypothetical protein LCGC14_0452620 [marine sediment metagenome]|uniref:Prepilin peptidase A24 N-terminal domain-containing protein n=1 Tax=marine sediment metagenome TaxID=412755 RepID=A0A0F9V486_9ZZZZ|nr:prepilin peptidase [Phycisphaerae bacterium]
MDVMWLVFFALLGACVGSFLNVVIWRLPRGESIVFPSSHCPACGRPIRWFDNVPLVSWLVLRGRCRACHAPISPRYLLIEAATAAMVVGLYVAYYMLDLRDGLGAFNESWPTFLAHAALWCGLLACAAVDVEHWIVPLEVCWFVSLVGLVVGAVAPPDAAILPRVSPVVGAMGVAAAVGLGAAMLLTRWGLLRPSFIDADDKASTVTEESNSPGKKGRRIVAVAATKKDGINPRVEILHEVLFLAPAGALAAAVALLAAHVPAAGQWLNRLGDAGRTGPFAAHLGGFQAALVGYLVGGLWIWGMRIGGTLAFGKEAMGLGDVHLLAAVGAVTGWIVPSLTFFAAPVLGLLWGLRLMLSRRQRELPYGPWLAVAAGAVMIFHDPLLAAMQAAFHISPAP